MMKNREWGLSAWALKVIALVLMTMSYLYYFWNQEILLSRWMDIVGRLAAPLFIFVMAQSFAKTKSRAKYLLRLYIGFVLMNICNSLMNRYFPSPNGAWIVSGMFGTLFLVGVYIVAIEFSMKGVKIGDAGMSLTGLLLFCLPLFWGLLLRALWSASGFLPTRVGSVFGQTLSILRQPGGSLWQTLALFFPSPFLVEGGVAWIVLGLGFYYFRDSKIGLILFYTVMCGILLLEGNSGGFVFANLFRINSLWFLIFALPLMLLYNGEKGRDGKAFFYFYYPLHIYALVFISRLL